MSTSGGFLTVPVETSGLTRRKCSIPCAVQSTSLLTDGVTTGAGMNARRRLSNVGDAMSRKLSTTIGLGMGIRWSAPAVPAPEIISQGKCLCGQYIRSRLKRSGLFNRKLGFQRLRSIVGTPTGNVVRSVYPEINAVGIELERMHPLVYSNVSRQATRTPGGELSSADVAPAILDAVARDLFKTDITWGKIVSLFAVCGGLAVDCVRQGKPDYLPRLMEGVAEIIEDELAEWIAANGGWSGFSGHCKPQTSVLSTLQVLLLVTSITVTLVTLYILLRMYGSSTTYLANEEDL